MNSLHQPARPRHERSHAGRARSGAVVIGAGIAGLLAASALSDCYDDVVVIERDRLEADAVDPSAPARRAGAPQYPLAHAMLAAGRDAIEELVPGFTDDLLVLGARCEDFGRAGVFCVGPLRLAGGSFGLRIVTGGRDLQEKVLRHRVAALPGVTFLSGVSVLDLVFDAEERSVVGVRVTAPDTERHRGRQAVCGATGEEIRADLVVDASGRGSRSHLALARHGYAPPQEQVQRIDLRYTCRRFRVAPAQTGHQDLVAVVQSVAPGDPRGAIALHEHGEQWTVALSAYGAEHPPRELEAFRAYARSLARPEIADLLDVMEPVDGGRYFRVPSNVRRYYERLERMPAGLIVLGDALASFDPAFGQGMTVAALQCRSLRICLSEMKRRARSAGAPVRDQDLTARFQRRAAADLEESWATVSRRHAQVSGVPGAAMSKAADSYLRSLLAGATYERELALAFLRVANLTEPGSSMFAPAVAWQVAQTHAGRLTRAVRRRLATGRGDVEVPAHGYDVSTVRQGRDDDSEICAGHGPRSGARSMNMNCGGH